MVPMDQYIIALSVLLVKDSKLKESKRGYDDASEQLAVPPGKDEVAKVREKCGNLKLRRTFPRLLPQGEKWGKGAGKINFPAPLPGGKTWFDVRCAV